MPLSSTRHSPQALGSIAVLIPAWKPDRAITELVAPLLDFDFGAIVLVDDGNGERTRELFTQLATSPTVHVVAHAVNLGKGRALKTGFNFCLTELDAIEGVITADADGQHLPQDIARVAETLVASEGDHLVLGARGFQENVPLRSRLGNGLTRALFGFITGTRLRDTQTGLRGIPRTMLPGLMLLDGERYEYEMAMLAHVCRTGNRPIEVGIETVYIDGNKSSHFDPVLDSMRIYFVLGRFFASSIIAAGIDFVGFTATFAVTHSILASVIVGRLSSLVNFALNRRYVFRNESSIKAALVRYYLLAAVIAASSYGLIMVLTEHGNWNVLAAKILVDVLLSLISFSMQRAFVFRRTEAE